MGFNPAFKGLIVFKNLRHFDKKFGFQSMSDVCLFHSLLPQVSAIYGGYLVARERRHKQVDS